jgi:hypothetical protein
MGFADRFKEIMQEREGQVRSAVDKAGSFVDEKTKGKYHQQITKAGQKADEMITKSTQEPGSGGYQPGSGGGSHSNGYEPPASQPPPTDGPTA